MTTSPDRSRRCTRARLRRACRFVVLVGMVPTSAPQSSVAQEMPAPIESQVLFLTRVLRFDRELPSRARGELVVAVLYQSRFRESANTRADVERLLAGQRVGNLPVRVLSLEVEPGVHPGALLAELEPDVVYVAPLRAMGVADIVDATRTLRILTATGVPEYVEDGLSLGISLAGSSPRILINVDASIAEGARFSSELLKLPGVVEVGQRSY